jgi:cell division septum initiation protein DivIVA
MNCCLIVIVQLRSVAVRGSRDSDDLVPLHEPFETALRGFNRQQVLDHLESLDGRIAIVAADRDAAMARVAELSRALEHLRSESELLAHLRREAEKATERILAAPMAEASARIQRILRLAEEEAAEVKAHIEAEIIASKAHADQNIAERKARADDQIAVLRAQASREAKSLLDHARGQCDQLESESAARREAAEHDSAETITRQEASANERIRNAELRSLGGLHLILRVMDEYLRGRSLALEQDESALRELRTQVASETTTLGTVRAEVTAAVIAAHQLLTEALGQVRKIPVERALGEPDPAQQPDVPTQRGTQSGKVYLLNTAEDRRLPRTPR